MSSYMRPKILLCIIALFTISSIGLAQDKPSKTEKALAKKAYTYLDDEQYDQAIEKYLELLAIKPNHPQYNFEIGIAYLRSPREFPKAQGYLEKALKYSTEDTIPELYYYLGKAYQNNHDFAKAKESYGNFTRFIKPTASGAKLKNEVSWLQKTCDHGEYHVKLNTKNPLENKAKPINNVKKYFLNATDYVIIENLGENINSIHDDEGAVFFRDETEIFYTSKRNPVGNANEMSYDAKYEHVYVSRTDADGWITPRLLQSIGLFDKAFDSPTAHTSVVSLNKDETHMIFYKDEILFETAKNGDKWTTPIELNKDINLAGARQPSAFLSDNGKTLIVVSDREGGYGERDMYITRKAPDGSWVPLENMGSVLNTEQDEDTPFMLGDSLLYFSSKGHSSIGGYDIFYSKWDGSRWGTPQSLGIPINSPQDEISYVRSKADINTAYYSSSRVDGYGYQDIYKLSTYYKVRKRGDLPQIAMGDFLSDDLATATKSTGEATMTENVVEEKNGVIIPENTKETTGKAAMVDPNKSSGSSKTETAETSAGTSSNPPLPKAQEDIFKDILFAFNKMELTPDSDNQIKKIAEYMKQNPEFVISLSGHADYLGSNEVNDDVSKQRALLVTNKLVAAGVDPYHINYSYYGETKPTAEGKNADGSDNPEGRAKNRRVEFTLYQNKMFRVVEFGSNSSKVSSTEAKKLEQIAEYLKSNANATVRLAGFSDSVGNADYNRVLSERRVKDAAAKLKALGIAENRMVVEFFGEDKPCADGTNARRVEIYIR